jgi:DNA-binding transcriptional MerR regulator
VGELAGVSGTTVGQWARRGYIRASQSAGDPHVYSLEDVLEAVAVGALLRGGARHADIRRALERLRDRGDWPLSQVCLGLTQDGRPRIVLREGGGIYALGDRGWQLMGASPPVRELPLRVRRVSASDPAPTGARTRRPRRSPRARG